MSIEQELADARRQNSDLQVANNELLERARAAEASISRWADLAALQATFVAQMAEMIFEIGKERT